jgi:hypothetical protein
MSKSTDGKSTVAHCEDCAFWCKLGEADGVCRFLAPHPAASPNEVAHWPRTRNVDYCGEWVRNGLSTPPAVLCGRCVYWRHPFSGLHPTGWLDQSSEWWSGAGHCLRFPPSPSSEPGARAFWPATNERDGCFQGKARAP